MKSVIKDVIRTVAVSSILLATGASAVADDDRHGYGHRFGFNAVTVWWVIFNAPENCYGSPDPEANCTSVDIFGTAFLESIENGSPNPALIAPNMAAKPAVLYATGDVTDFRGRVRLAASIYKVAADTQQSLPPGVDPMGFGRGYENEAAEVHLVVRDHGRAKRRDLLPQITNFLDPYCSDPNLLYFAGKNLCVDTHFAVFGAQEAGDDAVFAFANMRRVPRAKATLLRDGDVIRAVIETRIRNR